MAELLEDGEVDDNTNNVKEKNCSVIVPVQQVVLTKIE